jgi:hypothetical protein
LGILPKSRFASLKTKELRALFGHPAQNERREKPFSVVPWTAQEDLALLVLQFGIARKDL